MPALRSNDVCYNSARDTSSRRRHKLSTAIQHQVWKEAGYRCANHAAHPISLRSWPVEVHHIVPWRQVIESDADDPKNLIALCPACHVQADRNQFPLTIAQLHELKRVFVSAPDQLRWIIRASQRDLEDALKSLSDHHRTARNAGLLNQHLSYLEDLEKRFTAPTLLQANVVLLRAKTVRLRGGNFPNVRLLLLSAREIAGRFSNKTAGRRLLADISYNLGYLSYLTGSYADAIRSVEEGARLASEAHDLVSSSMFLTVAAVAKVRSGADKIPSVLERARRVFENSDGADARDWRCTLLNDEADMLLRLAGRRPSARAIDRVFDALDESEKEMRANDDSSAFTGLHRLRGRAHLAVRDWSRAAQELELARNLECRFRIVEGQAATARDYGIALERLDRLDAALEVCQSAIERLAPKMDNAEAQKDIRRMLQKREFSNIRRHRGR